MLSKLTFQTIKIYVWIGHFLLTLIPIKWNSKELKFTETSNAKFIKFSLNILIAIKFGVASWFTGFSWILRKDLEIWEITMNIFVVSGIIVTTPLFYMCQQAGSKIGTLLNSVLLLNRKLRKFHNLSELSIVDGLEKPFRSIHLAVLLLVVTCPLSTLYLMEYYPPRSITLILSFSPIDVSPYQFYVNILLTCVISFSFACDAYVASGFLQFSMIMINLTNGWLKQHVWIPCEVRNSYTERGHEKSRVLMRAIQLIHNILVEDYSYSVNPVYISTSLLFLTILLFLIVRYFMTLNFMLIIVLCITAHVLIYCMEVSFIMGTKTIEYSSRLTETLNNSGENAAAATKSQTKEEDLKFIQSYPTLSWKIGVFYSIDSKIFLRLMSEFTIPTVINLLVSATNIAKYEG